MQIKSSFSLVYYSLAVHFFFWNTVTCSHKSEIKTESSVHGRHHSKQSNPSSPAVDKDRNYFESIMMMRMASEKETGHGKSSLGLPSGLSDFSNYGRKSAPAKQRHKKTTRDKTITYSGLAKETKKALVLLKSLHYLMSSEKDRKIKPNMQEIELLHNILSKPRSKKIGDKKNRYSKPVSERKETLKRHTIKSSSGNKFLFSSTDLARIFQTSKNLHNEIDIHSRKKEKEFPPSNSTQQFSPVDLEFMKSFISFVNQMKSKSKNMKTEVRSDIERKKIDPARVTLQVDPGLHLFIQNGNDMGTETSFGHGKSIKPKYILKTTSAGTEDKATSLMSNSDSKIKPETFVLSSRKKKVFEVLAPSKFESPEYFTHLPRTNRNDEARKYRQRPPMFNSLKKDITDDRSPNFISKANLGNKGQIATLTKYLGHSPIERLVQRPAVSDLIKIQSLGEVNRDMKPKIGRFSIISTNPTSKSDQRIPRLVPFDIHNNQESRVLHVTHKQPHVVDSNPLNINIEKPVSHKTRHPGLQGHLSSTTLEVLKRLHKVGSIVSNQPISHSQILIDQESELNDRRTHAINYGLPYRVLEQQSRNKIIYQDRLFHDVNAGRTNVYDESRSRLARNEFPVMQQSHIKYVDVFNNEPAENQDLVTRVRLRKGSQQYRFNKDPVSGIYSQRERIGPSQYYSSVQNNKHRLHIQETLPSPLLIRHSQHQRPGSRNSDDAIPHYTSDANKQIIHVIHHTKSMPSDSKFHYPKQVESYGADHTVPSRFLSGSNSKRSEHIYLHQKPPQKSNVPMTHSSQIRQRNEYSVSVNTEKQTLHKERSGLNYVAENQRVSKSHNSFSPRAIHQINGQNTATGFVKSNFDPYHSTKINDNRYNILHVDKRIQQASSESMLDKNIRPESPRFTQPFGSYPNEKSLTGHRHASQMSPDASIVNVDVMTNADHRDATRSVNMHLSFNDVPKNQGRIIHTEAGFDVAHKTEIPTKKSNRHKIETYSYDPQTPQPLGRSYEGTNRQSKRFPAIVQQTVKYVQTKIVPQKARNQNKKVHGTILGTTGSIGEVPSRKYFMNSNAGYQITNGQQYSGNSPSVNVLRTDQYQHQQHKTSKRVTEPTKFMPSNHASNFERRAIQKSNEYHKPTKQQQVVELTNKIATRTSVNHGGSHTSLHSQEPNALTGYGIPKPRYNYDPSVVQNQPVSPGTLVVNQRYPWVETPANTNNNLTALRTELNSLISRFDQLQMHGSSQNIKQEKQAAFPIPTDIFQSPYKSRALPSKEVRIKKEPYHKIRNIAFDKLQNTINVNADTTNIHHRSNGQSNYTRQSKHSPNFVDGGFPLNVLNGVPVKFQNQEKSHISQLPQSSHGGNLKNANQNVNTSKVALNLHRERFYHPSARIPVTIRTNSSIPNHSVNVSQQIMTANSTPSKSNIPLTKNTMLINRQQKVNSSKQQTLLQTKSKISRHVVDKLKDNRQKAPNLPNLDSKGVKPNAYQQRHSTPMQNNFYNKLGDQNQATEIKLQIQPYSHDVRFEVSVQARKQIRQPNVQTVKDIQNAANTTNISNIQPF